MMCSISLILQSPCIAHEFLDHPKHRMGIGCALDMQRWRHLFTFCEHHFSISRVENEQKKKETRTTNTNQTVFNDFERSCFSRSKGFDYCTTFIVSYEFSLMTTRCGVCNLGERKCSQNKKRERKREITTVCIIQIFLVLALNLLRGQYRNVQTQLLRFHSNAPTLS